MTMSLEHEPRSRRRGVAATGWAPTPGAPGGRHRGVGLLRTGLWIVVSGLVVLPLGAIVVLAVIGGRWGELGSPDVLTAARNSVVSAGLSAVGAVVLGTLWAVLLERTDIRGKQALRMFVLSPLLVPPFVGAIAWTGIAGPTSPINRAFTEWFGGPLWIIYGGDGVVFLLIVHSYPLAYVIVSAALRRIPADLELAARISGARPREVLSGVTIPLLRPALLSSFTLIAVSNLADFGIPSIIGLPERFHTLSTLVYRAVQSRSFESPLELVATIGVALLTLAILGMVIDFLLTSRAAELDTSSAPAELLRLGRGRMLITLAGWTLALALTLLPLWSLATQALLPAPGVPLTLGNLTLDNLVRALTSRVAVSGAQNSVWLALTAGVVCGVLGLLVGALVARTRSRGNGGLRTLAMLPQAVPGLVIGVGWLIVAPRLGLFNTPWLILLAYVMAFLGIVIQSVMAPLRSVPLDSEEAARVSGARPLRALLDVPVRLAIPAAVAGAALVVLTAVRELTISVLLLSPGSQTLGVAIFNLQQAGSYNAAAALSLVVALVGLAGLALVSGTPRRRAASPRIRTSLLVALTARRKG